MLGHYKPIEVHCEDNGSVVTGEVIYFSPQEYIKVAFGGIELNLQWNRKLKEFRTTRSGLDFVVQVPEAY